MKGNCALLVKHPVIRRSPKRMPKFKNVEPKEKKIAIANNKHKSPIRFERSVIILVISNC